MISLHLPLITVFAKASILSIILTQTEQVLFCLVMWNVWQSFCTLWKCQAMQSTYSIFHFITPEYIFTNTMEKTFASAPRGNSSAAGILSPMIARFCLGPLFNREPYTEGPANNWYFVHSLKSDCQHSQVLVGILCQGAASWHLIVSSPVVQTGS